jgi:hypothetical protein
MGATCPAALYGGKKNGSASRSNNAASVGGRESAAAFDRLPQPLHGELDILRLRVAPALDLRPDNGPSESAGNIPRPAFWRRLVRLGRDPERPIYAFRNPGVMGQPMRPFVLDLRAIAPSTVMADPFALSNPLP